MAWAAVFGVGSSLKESAQREKNEGARTGHAAGGLLVYASQPLLISTALKASRPFGSHRGHRFRRWHPDGPFHIPR